jgi:hypothetical protein
MKPVALELPNEPDPAGSAPEGTGNLFGQFGGSEPDNEIDTWPSGVVTSKPLFAVVVVSFELLLSDEQAAAPTNTMAMHNAVAIRALMVVLP